MSRQVAAPVEGSGGVLDAPGGATSRVFETHISRLFFTPDRVYKLLKPISTGFLDHTETSRRVAALSAEYELNRRFAPDVYLGTADVHEHGELADRMLVMKRLPDARRLSQLAGDPAFEDRLVTVARAIAAFHLAAPVVTEPVPLASATGLGAFWKASADEMQPFVGELFEPIQFDEVSQLAANYLDHHEELFIARQAAGFVRDGHGDLIADDIFMLDDGPRILDCLAFDHRYRICDVLADIAFLVMDVEHFAGRAAARHLLRAYCSFTGEHHPASLAHHYVAYRAHVRAKVAALRWRQGDAGAAAEAREHFAQAVDHLRRAQVRLVLLGGGPGTGKSTLADSLAGVLGWAALDCDTLRKDLQGVDHRDHHTERHPALYSEATTDTTYRRLIEHGSRLLRAGESVVLDATWARAAHRDLARTAALDAGARLVEIELAVDADVARDRIRQRARCGENASDATPDLVGCPRDFWPTATRIDTAEPTDEVCAALVRWLAE